MIKEMPSWLKKFNDWLTLIVTSIGALTIVAGTEWLEATRSWVYLNAPNAVVTLLRSIGWAIHSVIEPYRQATIWLFGLLPYDFPEWLAIALPPILMVTANLVSAQLFLFLSLRREKATVEVFERYASRVDRARELTKRLESTAKVSNQETLEQSEKLLSRTIERGQVEAGKAIVGAKQARAKGTKWLKRAMILAVVFAVVFLIEWIYMSLAGRQS